MDERVRVLEQRWRVDGDEEARQAYIRQLIRVDRCHELPSVGDLAPSYNWTHVFEDACGTPDTVPPGKKVVDTGFTVEDVNIVIALYEDTSEGYAQWKGHAVVLLNSGRWATLYGWCDTTGWG